jgi:hypothetical protein
VLGVVAAVVELLWETQLGFVDGAIQRYARRTTRFLHE